MACLANVQPLAGKASQQLLQSTQRVASERDLSRHLSATCIRASDSDLRLFHQGQKVATSIQQPLCRGLSILPGQHHKIFGVHLPLNNCSKPPAASRIRAMAGSSAGAATAVQAVFIFMHGLGDSGDSWEGITWDFKQETGFEKLKWEFPNAPLAPVSCNGEVAPLHHPWKLVDVVLSSSVQSSR
jgi:hypothetical protein